MSAPSRIGRFGARGLHLPVSNGGHHGRARGPGRLAEHRGRDASDISVEVANGEVTLEGTVDDRQSKRLAENLAHSVSGVRDVHNRLRIAARAAEPDVDVRGPASHSGTGFLTRNIEVSPRRK